MWRQLANRLIFLIPTLFAIIVIAFILNYIAPGDEVDGRINLEGTTNTLGRSEYLDQYKRVASDLNLNTPPFYFSINPSYYPDTLMQLVPKAYRLNMTNLLRQTKNWGTVEKYHLQLDRTIRLIEPQTSQYRSLYVALRGLEQKSNISSVTSQMQTVNAELPESESKTNIHQALTSLQLAVANLHPSNDYRSFPILKWNGRDCRFHAWMTEIVKVRRSKVDGMPVNAKIGRALKWTLSISLIALLLSGFLGLVFAYFQTLYDGSWGDRISKQLFYFVFAIPTFWLATVMVVFFTSPEYGSWTNIFPSVGLMFWMIDQPYWVQFFESSKQLILPILILVIKSLAYLTRQIKTKLVEVWNEQFVQVARSKGLTKAQILRKHALPNAMLPFITIMTGALPRTLVGSVVIEVIFNIPGMGSLLLRSITDQDWPITFSILVLVGTVTIIAYFLADVLNAMFFPKMAKELIDN